jgi:hypothetical protein
MYLQGKAFFSFVFSFLNSLSASEKWRLKCLALIALLFLLGFQMCSAQAVITQWDFETGSPLAGGNATPNPTTGSGTSQIVGNMAGGGGVATGVTSGCGGNATGTQGWQIDPSNPGTLETSGVQFKVSTIGYENIEFTYDHRFSNAAPRTVRIQYTIDGTNWTNFTLTSSNFTSGCANRSGIDNGKIDVADPITNNAGDTWSRRRINFSSITAANDNPHFGVRILASHYAATNQFRRASNLNDQATAGTWRFDNVTFLGTPIVDPSFNPFQSCNLLVYKIGDGLNNVASNSSAFPIQIQEIDNTGSSIQTVNNFTNTNILTQSGSASSNGYLNTHNNLLAIPGYNAAVGTASVNGTNTKRVIHSDNDLIYSIYDLPTTAPIPFDSDNFRSVIPTGSNTFYASGNSNSSGARGGVWYYNGSSYVQLISGNVRNIEIFNDTLYFSAASAAIGNLGVYKFSNGLPTTASQVYEPVATYTSTITTAGPYGFSISPDGCTLYIADAGSTGVGSYPGISKWTRSGGVFNHAYSFNIHSLGIVVDYSGINPIIYATTTEGNNNRIVKIEDSGNSAGIMDLISAGTNNVFRGIDFTPISNQAISITTQPLSSFACVNASINNLSVIANSTLSLGYQWYVNDVNSLCGATPIPGATTSAYSPPTNVVGVKFYFVKITGNCASIKFSNIVAVTIFQPAIISQITQP